MPKILMPYTVHLDNTLRVTPVSTLFYKGDSNAHRFELNVLSKGLQADLSGCTAVYRFYRMQDRTVVSNPASIESGKVVAVLDKACYDYIGRFALTIAIQNGEDETTVFYGDGYMSGNRADTGITGDYVVYDVETLLAKIAEIETAIANANTAIANANTAAENANAAEDNANAAASGAQSAAGSANEAASAANTAAGKANTAAGAANTAAQTANSAASSAQTATQNANAATQASQTQQQTVAKAEAERDTAEQARKDAEQARQETFAGFEGEIGSLKDDVAAITPDDTVVDGKPWSSKKTADSLCMPIEATGNPVQVYPVEGYPLGVKVSWEPVQEGSGDPSPDNVRPITGRDAVSVTRCGKNLLESPGTNKEDSGIVFTANDDGTVTINGTATRTTYYNYNTRDNPKNLPEGDYVLMPGSGVTRMSLYNMETNATYSSNAGANRILHIPAGNYGVYIAVDTKATADNVIARPQIVLGSTPTAYEPYTGSTTDIALPETVYGGTLDLDTGVVTVDMGYKILKTGNINFIYDGDGSFIGYLRGEPRTVISSHYVSSWKTSSETYRINNINNNIYIVDPRFTNANDFVAWLDEQNEAGTPVQISYKMETPYTIQLTPHQIAALSGVNTLYTDAGTLTVTGREDPRHTIVTLTDRIAALESAAAGV